LLTIAKNAGANVAIGELFSYGIVAELGSANGGESTALP
jgi:hypothetical protein